VGIVIVVVVTLAAGVLSAYLPARQAGRLDVLDALRYD
jgi:ABC-type antimicrobial peptide transport system permease subunit